MEAAIRRDAAEALVFTGPKDVPSGGEISNTISGWSTGADIRQGAQRATTNVRATASPAATDHGSMRDHAERGVASHLDVGGFQIPMNDPLLVRRFERLGDLLRDRQRLVQTGLRRARCAVTDPRLQRVPSRAR
jgi:hypothetical protein